MRLRNCMRLGLLAASCMPTAAWAKSDVQMWTVASANVKLSDKWRLSEEVIGRFSSNRDGLYEIEAVTMLGYRLAKNVTLAAGYVHNPQYAGGNFTIMERRAREQLSIDNFAKLGSGKLSARARFEQRWRDNIDRTGWRFRPYLKYSLPFAGKATLNFSTEPFFNLNTTSFQRQSGLDRVRNLVTIAAPLSKKINAEFGYMNQHGFVRHGEDSSDNIAYAALSANF
ncbi:MAG: DUF2490 domain-containing protein [Sphingomonas sp.]|nr:DUF2490 domain-containing protein [Sphingomonas sp.]